MSGTLEIFVNTSPLQYLHQIGQLDLLPVMYGHVIVPLAVRSELHAGLVRGVDVPKIDLLPWVSTEPADPTALAALPAALGDGEREVISLAISRRGLAVLDDRRARLCAQSLGVSLTGTLGILVKARLAGHIAQIAPLLDELQKRNFYLKPQTRAAALQQAGETS